MQHLLFLAKPNCETHAILNLDNALYIEGNDERGSVLVHSAGGHRLELAGITFEDLLDHVRNLLGENYKNQLQTQVDMQDRMLKKFFESHERHA